MTWIEASFDVSRLILSCCRPAFRIPPRHSANESLVDVCAQTLKYVKIEDNVNGFSRPTFTSSAREWNRVAAWKKSGKLKNRSKIEKKDR